MDGSSSVRPYQFSVLTSRQPTDVLEELATRRIEGFAIEELGPNHLILNMERPTRYGATQATFLAVALVLINLVAIAYVVPLSALLPVSIVGPYILLGLVHRHHRPIVAVSGVPEGDGATRITAHGEVSAELAASLDAFFATLPVITVTATQAV